MSLSRIPIFSIFPAALVMISASALAGGGPIPIDDFADGDDVGWTHHDATGRYGPANYDASSGAYRIWTTQAIPAGTPVAATAAWDASTSPYFANGVVRGKVRVDQPNTIMVVALRYDPVELRDYAFVGSPTEGFFLLRVDCSLPGEPGQRGCPDPPSEFIAGYVPAEPYLVGDWWMFEASAVGDQLSFKAWPADGDEPRLPQIVATDGTYSDGQIAVATGNGLLECAGLDATFDDLTFTPALPADLNGDGVVNGFDLATLLAAWGACSTTPAINPCIADLDGNGIVNGFDLATLLAAWTT